MIIKNIVVTIALILTISLGGYAYVRGLNKTQSRSHIPNGAEAAVERATLRETVSATGVVTPAQQIDLAFERSGKVERVSAEVGATVGVGDSVVALESADVNAQLAQAEADLKVQQAKLEELRRGAKPEDIQITKAKLESAKKEVDDATINFENISQKGESDLTSSYAGVQDILNDAYAKSYDALHKYISEMFDNPPSHLLFVTTNTQAAIDAEWQVRISNDELNLLKKEIDVLPSDQTGLDASLVGAQRHILVIKNFLIRLNDALNSASALPQIVMDTDKTNLSTARANINAVLSAINSKTQSLTTQRRTNQQNVSAAQTRVDEAKSGLAISENSLSLVESGATVEQIQQQEAFVEKAIANVAFSRVQVAKTILRSPIAGVMTRQDAKLGAIVSANARIASVMSNGKYQIDSYVSQKDITKVHKGDSATVTLDAYGSTAVFNARVITLDPAETIVNGIGTYKITLEFANNDERIKSGLTANVVITTATRENVLAIPQSAIITSGDKVFVLIPSGSASPEKRDIAVGIRDAKGFVEVISGVKEGERIVSYGNTY